MRSPMKSVLLWVMLVVLFVSLYQFVQHNSNDVREIDFSEFLTKVDNHDVVAVTSKDGIYTGTFKDNSSFTTRGPIPSDTLTDRLHKNGVKTKFADRNENSVWVQI